MRKRIVKVFKVEPEKVASSGFKYFREGKADKKLRKAEYILEKETVGRKILSVEEIRFE